MKRIAILFTLLICLCSLIAGHTSANGKNEGSTDFIKALDKKLTEENYYDKGSVQVIDSLSKEAKLTKVVAEDDPKTEKNEEKIESYSSNVIAALVEFKLQKDSIFFIKKQELFYYDVDKQKFLTTADFINDKELTSFNKSHTDDVDTVMSLGSEVLVTVLLLASILFMPLMIMLLHNKSIPLPMRRRNAIY